MLETLVVVGVSLATSLLLEGAVQLLGLRERVWEAAVQAAFELDPRR